MNDQLKFSLNKALLFHEMIDRDDDMYMSNFEHWVMDMGLYETLTIKEPGWEFK